MRTSLFFVSFFFSLIAVAEDFVVFEKDGYFGIKDNTGVVTVPAVYETLGWSDGGTQVQNGVIGFKRDKLWGLITVRNKPLTDQKYYSITPLSNGYIKASLKGRFSNYLFHGILDDRGKIIISFNYFSVEPFGGNWLISNFNGKKQSFGVVTSENEKLLPTNYRKIEEGPNLFFAESHNAKIDVFSSGGLKIVADLDSIRSNNGWVIYKDGYAGFLDNSGKSIHDIEFKFIESSENGIGVIKFPEWKIYKNDSLMLSVLCDSLNIIQNHLMIAYLNGANQLILNNKKLSVNGEFKASTRDHLIFKNNFSKNWEVITNNGLQLFSGYDSIQSIGRYFIVENENKWNIVNLIGDKQNRIPYESIAFGLQKQLIVKRNNYWGIVQPGKGEITSLKYDSIKVDKDIYLVSYLNRWGAINKTGEWMVRPEFAEVFSYGDLTVGRRGLGYSYFHKGKLVYKSTDKPLKMMGGRILVKNELGHYGLYNKNGFPVISSRFNKINFVGNYFILENAEGAQMVDANGRIVLDLDEGYKIVSGFGEGFYLAKKENRWGFIDEKGRLRISNRYDSASIFYDNRSAVLLRSKWGFIDKNENLKVQPYYDEVSSYRKGMAIVKQANSYALINAEGKEVLGLMWKTITRLPTGNYIVEDLNNRLGLVNENGRFILRPAYDDLEDIGGLVLVSKNSEWGVLDYSGKPVFKINHEEIKLSEDLLFIKN